MEMICIQCPNGCHLSIEQNEKEIKVTGNICPRGQQYAIQELTDPRRTLTTTVKIISKTEYRLPVISEKQLPKDVILPASLSLKDVEVKAPIHRNDVVVENILGTGINILAAKSILK